MSGLMSSMIGRIAARMTRRTLERIAPEFWLVAASCQWPPSPRRAEAIAAAWPATPDWRRLFRIAGKHRVWGLVGQGLRQGDSALPPEVARHLENQTRPLARRGLELIGETARLQRLFDEAGVPVIVLKGAALAVLAYGDLAVKSSMDIDLLVAPADVWAAKGVLERAGCVAQHAPAGLTRRQVDLMTACGRELGFWLAEKKLLIELQWKLNYNNALLQNIGAPGVVQSFEIGGIKLATLEFEDLFAYLCVHGAQHRWERLKWLADLAAMLARRPRDDLDRLYRFAQRAGGGRCAGQALLLCHRLLGLDLPARLEAELRGDGYIALLEAIALGAMTARGGAAKPIGGAVLRTFAYMFLLGSGPRFLWREITRYSVAPADVFYLTLPPRLGWLYPFLRLPIWLLRKI